MAFYEEEEIMSMPLWRQLVEKDWNLLQSIEPRDMDDRGKKMLKHDLFESGPALIAMKGLPCTGKSCCASDITTFLRCPHLDFHDIRNCTRQAHQHLLLSTDPEVAASAHSHLDELSCRALLQFASTQLLLGHDVVVDSELSHPEEMRRLMDLADSNGVPLIVIECVVIRESKWRKILKAKVRDRLREQKSKSKSKASPSASSSIELEVRRLLEGHPQRFDGETNDVPRLVIDTTQRPFLMINHVNDVIIKFILLYKQNLGSKCNATASSSHELVRRDGEKLKRHFSHSHPLTFVRQRDTADMDSSAAAAAAPQCRICLLHITGSSYSCPRCNFSAHESCIELPQYTSFSLHIHPLGLYVQLYDTTGSEEDGLEEDRSGDDRSAEDGSGGDRSAEDGSGGDRSAEDGSEEDRSEEGINYDDRSEEGINCDDRSEEGINCIVCNEANNGPIYRCWQCYDVFVHPKCAQLSHELKHPCHDHPLKLETYDLFPKRNQFTCRACGHKGGKISYGCSACKLKLHIACALDLPLEVEYKCAQGHPLVLASPPKQDLDEYYCDICEEERYGDYWIYYCRSCEFHAHLNCANPEIQAYDIAEAKKCRGGVYIYDKKVGSGDDSGDDDDEEEEDDNGDDDEDKKWFGSSDDSGDDDEDKKWFGSSDDSGDDDEEERRGGEDDDDADEEEED